MSTRASSRSKLEHQVREYFPDHVAACEQFEAFAADMLEADPWRGRAMGEALADRLVASESARSLKTYRAAIDAALAGFGPQAAMLNRALFEGMATTCWTTLNPELAGERFRKHLRHNKGQWSRRYLARGLIDRPLEDTPDEAEMRALDKQFGTWGTKLWCGLAMHELVNAIENQWERPEELRIFFAYAHAANNETQHTSARSLTTPVITDSESDFGVDAGPSVLFVEQALYASLWIYANMLRVTASYFEIEGREQVAPVFARLRRPCEPIATDQARNVGRNDPCPCGSEKKFKRCHGRYGSA